MTDPKLRIYDNTQVSGNRNCNRRRFYRHDLHLTRPGGSPPLAFGSGWHSAMDVIWSRIRMLDKNGNPDEMIDLARDAYQAWEADWTENGFPSAEDITDDQLFELKARTPDTAIEMIARYIEERWDTLHHDFEPVAVEQPFVVPLDPDDPYLWYSGRLDKVFRYRGKLWIVDHKTTSMYAVKGGFQRSFLDSFTPNSQIDGYAYGAKLIYGEEFGGVYIDAALVHKNHHDQFALIPVSRSQEQLDSWLWETREEIRRIERDKEAVDAHWLFDDSDNTFANLQANPDIVNRPYLAAAPKNPGNCWNFNSPCAYLDLCKSWGNPVKGLIETGVPSGYVIEEWSPFTPEQITEVEQLIKEFK